MAILMSMRIPKLSILISMAAHAALICAILWAGGLLPFSKGGGSGGSDGAIVSVWVADSNGRSFSESKGPSRNSLQATRTDRTRQISKKSENMFGARSSGAGDGAGGTAGSGVGRGEGSGAGDGSEGDETLARIWKRIDYNKYYPMIAKRQHVEGIPKVTFELNDDGSVKWVKLATSCGSKILDDAAVETVRRAAPLPFYPSPITLALKYSISE